jgi:hypothetical protein
VSNTVRIAIDDNTAMQKISRQGNMELGLTEYLYLQRSYYPDDLRMLQLMKKNTPGFVS